MSTSTTPTTQLDAANLIRQMGFDEGYYRRLVAPDSETTSITISFTKGGSLVPVAVSVPGSQLPAFLRDRVPTSTTATNSETIKRLFAEGAALDSQLRWETIRDVLEWLSCSSLTIADGRSDDSLTDVIESARQHPSIRYGERLADQLQRLLDISREEQPEQAPPALASVKALIAFLASNPSLAYPATVLTPDGNVRVEWRRGRDEHFAVEFLAGVDVRFVVFAPDPTHPYKTIRVAGGATVDSLMNLVAPYGVEGWATEEIPRQVP